LKRNVKPKGVALEKGGEGDKDQPQKGAFKKERSSTLDRKLGGGWSHFKKGEKRTIKSSQGKRDKGEEGEWILLPKEGIPGGGTTRRFPEKETYITHFKKKMRGSGGDSMGKGEPQSFLVEKKKKTSWS